MRLVLREGNIVIKPRNCDRSPRSHGRLIKERHGHINGWNSKKEYSSCHNK